MSQLENKKMNFTDLFVAFCHALIFNFLFQGEESAQKMEKQLKINNWLVFSLLH